MLVEEHKQLSQRLQKSEREYQLALGDVQRLERVVDARNQELAQTEESIRVHSREAEQLRSHSRELEKIKTQRDDALQAEAYLRSELQEAQRARTAESAELATLKERTKQLAEETNKLQRRIQELLTESADKEVRIVQLNKARAQDLEDKDGLNVALQSKQQELELVS
jgi:chromosome segregation ATPase